MTDIQNPGRYMREVEGPGHQVVIAVETSIIQNITIRGIV